MREKLYFTKMHGAGNDFVVLDGVKDKILPIASIFERLTNRHKGVGCDQILVIRPSSIADFRMEIFNADGSQVEMCGNGVRVVMKFLRDRRYTLNDEVEIETLGGVVTPCWMGNDMVRVNMGRPVLAPELIPTFLGRAGGPVLDESITIDDEIFRVSCISMGNPHAVMYVNDLDYYPVAEIGSNIERSSYFPNKVNVEFVQVISRSYVRQRTWERGSGETLACGSGACAVVVSSILNGITDRRVTVELRGGNLEIEWPSDTDAVFMTGPAAEVFSGSIYI